MNNGPPNSVHRLWISELQKDAQAAHIPIETGRKIGSISSTK